MDKYEYKLKIDQIRALAAEGDYAAAAELADMIRWHKVRNVNLLMKAGEIYAKQKRYEDARDVLLYAYDRSPIRRMIVFRLAEIAVKMKAFEEAEEYYNEFVEAAPHDNQKYVLRFKISRAKGEDWQTQIAILEELKEVEYTEEWAYHLAYLYHKAGAAEKCVEACDELVLWFGDGIYVERALELKMHYEPLTKAQEDKYRMLKQGKSGAKEENVVRIPRVRENVDKFNTANLQEELAKSMQQIMDATERETVDDTMDSIKRMVEDIPYLKLQEAAGLSEEEDEEERSLRDRYREILAEDSDGQYQMLVKDGIRESQIDGQMSIQDVLSDWEKTGRAIQAALRMAEQQKLESVKAKALREVGDVMDRLVEIMPSLNEGVVPGHYWYADDSDGTNASYEERTGRLVADMNHMLQQQIDRLQEEAAGEEAGRLEKQPEEEEENQPDLLRKLKRAKPNFDEQIGVRPYRPRQFGEVKELFSAVPAEAQEEVQTGQEQPKQAEGASEEPDMQFGMTEEELLEEKRLAEAEFYGIPPELLPKERPAVEDVPVPQQDFEIQEALLKQDTKEIKSKTVREAFEQQGRQKEVPDEENRQEEQEEKQDEKQAEGQQEAEADRKLSEGQKAFFSYFVLVAGMEAQISRVFSNTAARLREQKRASAGNILIQGERGYGKTVLAKSLVRALQKETGLPKGKVGKIDADSLNKKDLSKVFQTMAGGCLIIDGAPDLSRETAVKLSLLLDNDESGILLIMEGSRKGLEAALGQAEGLAGKFTERIKIPVFTSDELVEFGKAYAHDLDYEIDNMGILALYNSISNIQKLDRATTLTEVKEIVDRAIKNAEKKSLKKALSILTSRRYTKDDYVILREKDFEE